MTTFPQKAHASTLILCHGVNWWLNAVLKQSNCYYLSITFAAVYSLNKLVTPKAIHTKLGTHGLHAADTCCQLHWAVLWFLSFMRAILQLRDFFSSVAILPLLLNAILSCSLSYNAFRCHHRRSGFMKNRIAAKQKFWRTSSFCFSLYFANEAFSPEWINWYTYLLCQTSETVLHSDSHTSTPEICLLQFFRNEVLSKMSGSIFGHLSE